MDEQLNLPMEEQQQESGIQRGKPDVDAKTQALVKDWLEKIANAEKFWDDDFKRIREDQEMAYSGRSKDWPAENYVVPIIARHINQVVASLYAKNPTAFAEVKQRMDFVLWDGRPDTLQAALESTAAALQGPQVDPMTGAVMQVPPADPNALALIQEVSEVQNNRLMLKKVAKTMEIMLRYYMREQQPSFKKQLKQLVRRVKTCGIGYVFLGYQRLLNQSPELTARIEDATAQLNRLKSLQADLQDGLLPEDDKEMKRLETMLADLQKKTEIIVREGPVFDFPRATEIIIDPDVVQINGLIGANWFARKMYMRPNKVKDIYKIDLGSDYKPYKKMKGKDGAESYVAQEAKGENAEDCMVCLYEVWDKEHDQWLTVIDGYCGFVRAPEEPEFRLERFWPLFVLTFNDVEHDTKRMPLSDVHMARHIQNEYNRSREIRRQHRIANTPRFVTIKGRFSEEDKAKLSQNVPFAVLELNALAQGEDIKTLLQQLTAAPMDPALYETNTEMEDLYRTVGSQEAVLGGTSKATATEVSVGEQSRSTSLDSNTDDLDDLLSELVQATGEQMLLALDPATVKRIAGPGAVWPQLNRQEIVEQVIMDIKAGSSGRPNAAAELANIERASPYLLQMDDVKMRPVAEKYANLLNIDTEELIVEGLPSQTALNAMASKLTSGAGMLPPATPTGAGDAAGQGAQGGNNAEKPAERPPGPQPAYPTGAPMQ